MPETCALPDWEVPDWEVPDTCAVYVHWPYCARICPYCDFNVHKRRDDARLVPAILDDLARQRGVTGARRITSLHFGGGTPSLMEAGDVARVIEAVNGLWGLERDAEVGLEANPRVLDKGKVRAFASAGVNRMSFGVQTFDDRGLAFLGREHSGREARAVVEDARNVLDNLSVDLIFGWAGQGMASWERDLDTALALRVPHVSAYQLTIEAKTAFARAEARGVRRGVDGEVSADMYERAVERLSAAGMEHYEVSNFAKPGFRSRHNLAYWRGEDYVGAGPGAHGRITVEDGRLATVMPLNPKAYAEAPVAEVERLSQEDVAVEYLLMGLRTVEGIDAGRFARLSGRALDVEGLEGLVDICGERLRATAAGRRVLDAVVERLLDG